MHFGGGECCRAKHIIHFYCLTVEADAVECLPVDPVTWVSIPGWGKFDPPSGEENLGVLTCFP